MTAATTSLKPAAPRTWRVGMLGCGVVGQGVVKLFNKHREDFKRNGFDLQLTQVAVRDGKKTRDVDLAGVKVTLDPLAVAKSPDVDMLIEVMGGNTSAVEAACVALSRGVPVISANKAGLARSLTRYLEAGKAGNASVAFEAACAAHIPIIEALDRSLACEEISLIKGVINGSTNYILTLMERSGCDFAEALADASAKGFTEADPSLDVDGIDAAEKLSLLAYKAFGVHTPPDQIHTEGIRNISREDMELARQLGHRIKLIASARRVDGQLSVSVHPALVHVGELLADVDSEFNAIILEGPAFKELTFLGKGAGQLPTASAVLNDCIKFARGMGNAAALPGFNKSAHAPTPGARTTALSFCYFLRLPVISAGVVDGIAAFLEQQNVKVLSRAVAKNQSGEFLGLITDVVKESRLQHLLRTLSRVDGVTGDASFIRLDKDNYREIVELEQRAYFGTSLQRESRAGV
ncbi:MAG: homoserine dehydrogenase [Planctomycetes bacterium]|nr:homoserine dehydrogenase [Planctomycetota bacterium]